MTLARLPLFAGALALAACAGYVAGTQDALTPPVAATETAEAPPKPAYMVVVGDVYDREAFGAGYAAKLPPLYEKYGGSYLAVGRGPDILEGDLTFESFALGAWPSREAALAFWNSPEYEDIRAARIDNGWGEFDVFLVEGLPTPAQISPLAEESAARDEG